MGPRAPLDPAADKPRIVVDYQGVQILDAREHIRVVFKTDPPRGMRYCLTDAGFTPAARGVWQRAHSPDAIFQAQAIAKLFCGEANGKA